MTEHTRRHFLKRAALGTAVAAAFPYTKILGANHRVRVGMIGLGDRGQDLLDDVLHVPNVEVIAVAETRLRRSSQAFKRSTIIAVCST
jgi:hypothetical protein